MGLFAEKLKIHFLVTNTYSTSAYICGYMVGRIILSGSEGFKVDLKLHSHKYLIKDRPILKTFVIIFKNFSINFYALIKKINCLIHEIIQSFHADRI